jgi:hypothetical protein
MAGNYVILTKSGISTTSGSSITGNIGVSPAVITDVTGFSLTADASNQYSISNQVTGKIFAASDSPPIPGTLTIAVNNMETAYDDAAARSVDYLQPFRGFIGGKTLTSGVYKWNTEVLIESDLTLSGSENDVWIFQFKKGLTVSDGVRIVLSNGALAKNIFWQSAQTVTIGSGAHLEGIVLGKTDISLGSRATISGRLLAQSAARLDKSMASAP